MKIVSTAKGNRSEWWGPSNGQLLLEVFPRSTFQSLSICRSFPSAPGAPGCQWQISVSSLLQSASAGSWGKSRLPQHLNWDLTFPFLPQSTDHLLPFSLRWCTWVPWGMLLMEWEVRLWESRKGRWLQLRNKSNAVLNSAASWKPIPWRLGISAMASLWRSWQWIFSLLQA